MKKEIRDASLVQFKWSVLQYAKGDRTDSKDYSDFDVPKSIFYGWKRAFDKEGKAGLARKKPIAHNHPRSLKQDVVDQIFELRQTYKLGPERITWYLERYHGIKTSVSSVYRTLVRNGMRRLPKSSPRKAIHTRRYNKESEMVIISRLMSNLSL